MRRNKLIYFILIISTELYAQIGTFKTLEPMGTARYGMCAVVYEDMIWLIGGKSRNDSTLNIVECYHPYIDHWQSQMPSLQIARTNAAAVVYRDIIYIIGGKNSNNSAIATVEYFDPDERKWKIGSELFQAREALTAVVLNDTMFAIGGGMTTVDTNHLNSVEYWDTQERKWKNYPSWRLYQPRVSMATVVVNDIAYTFGGTYFGPVDYVERFSSGSKTELVTLMLNPRYSFTAVAVRDSIYIIGGANVNLNPSIEIYDTVNDTWDIFDNPLPVPRSELVSVNFEDNIFIFGGSNFIGLPVNITEMIELTPLPATKIQDRKVEGIPPDFQLLRNYPNPFNSSTVIPFQISKMTDKNIVLVIYNITGKHIKSFQLNSLPPGIHQVTWTGLNDLQQPVASGIYFCQLRVERLVKSTLKMMLLQ